MDPHLINMLAGSGISYSVEPIIFSEYNELVVFNDISLISYVVDSIKNPPRIVMVQEGSTDFTFSANKVGFSLSSKYIYKIYKYLMVGVENLNFLDLFCVFLSYFLKKTKSPYGFGIKKDLFILSDNLQLDNYNGTSVSSCVDNVSVEPAIVDISSPDFVIVHQPLYEQFTIKEYVGYYNDLADALSGAGGRVFWRPHPRITESDLVAINYDRAGIEKYSSSENPVFVGYSSTLLLENSAEGGVSLVFDGSLPTSNNMSSVLLNKYGNTLAGFIAGREVCYLKYLIEYGDFDSVFNG